MSRLTTIKEHIIPFYLFCHCIFFSIVLKFYSTISSTFLFKYISTVLKMFFSITVFYSTKAFDWLLFLYIKAIDFFSGYFTEFLSAVTVVPLIVLVDQYTILLPANNDNFTVAFQCLYLISSSVSFVLVSKQ